MSYSLVTSAASCQTSSGSTTSGVNTTGANLLVVAITVKASGSFPTVSDSKGNTWVVAHSTSDGTYNTSIYKCVAPTVGTLHTFTVAGTGTGGAIAMWAFSNGAGSSSQDQANDNGTASPGSITPTVNDEVIVTVCASPPGTNAPTACSGGYTVDGSLQDLMLNAVGISYAHLIQTTATASNLTWSGGSGVGTAAVVQSFKAGSTPVDTPLTGSPGAFTVAGSSAVMAARESGSPGAVAVAGSSAVMAARESGSPGAVAIAGSSALLTSGMGGSPGAVAIAGSSALGAIGERATSGAVAVVGKAAALAFGVGAARGAVLVAGGRADLVVSSSWPAATVHVDGKPATLVALSPVAPGPKPDPIPAIIPTLRKPKPGQFGIPDQFAPPPKLRRK